MKAKLLLTFLALLLTTTTDSFAVTAGYELDLCFAANEIGQREVITNYDSRSDMYVVKLKAKWDKFDPDLHQRGFWLQQSRGAKVISPTLPEGCKVFHIYGDLMGHEGMSHSLRINLQGKSCANYLSSFSSEVLQLDYRSVRTMNNTGILSHVRVNIAGVCHEE